MDFRRQQREYPPIHIDRPAVEKVNSFKFLSVHITNNLKWSTHTDSVLKKVQQRLFNLWSLKNLVLVPKTLTNFYRCAIEGILSAVSLPVTVTAQPATPGLSRGWCGLPNASPGANYLPTRTPTAPDVTGRPKRSTRTQPPKPLPGHPAIIQKAWSVQVHQSWD